MQVSASNFKQPAAKALLIVLAVLALCCNEQSLPVPSSGDNKLFVAGELNNTGQPVFAVAFANDLGTGSGIRYISDAQAWLTNTNSGTEYPLVYNESAQRYIASFIPTPGNTYRIRVEAGTNGCSGQEKLPSAFTATTRTTDNNTLMLSIHQPQAGDHYYVIDVFQKNGNSDNPLYFESKSELSDNYRYNETRFPYYRLFVPSAASEISVDLILPNPLNTYENLGIRIRSTSSDYYNYLYNSEAQLESTEKDIDLKGNLTGAFGIMGGAFQVVIQP